MVDSATERYIAELVTRNNSNNQENPKVFKVLKEIKNVHFTENVKKVSKLNKDELKAGLAFLEETSVEEVDKEVKEYSKEELVERVCDRFDHIRPAKCDKCQKIYSYELSEHIKYRCVICERGMCPDCCTSCEIKLGELNQAEILNKMLYFNCSDCVVSAHKESNRRLMRGHNEKNQRGRKPKSDAAKVATPEDKPEEVVEVKDDTSDEDDEVLVVNRKKKNDEKKQRQSEKKKEVKETVMCNFYKRNKCKFGKIGKDCKFFHPKHCHQWISKGREGCSRGNQCDHFHPALCHNSVNHQKCEREKCSFFHLPNTERTKKPNQNVPLVQNMSERPPLPKTHASQAQRTKVLGRRLEDTPFQQVQPLQESPGVRREEVQSLAQVLHALGEQVKELVRDSKEKSETYKAWRSKALMDVEMSQQMRQAAEPLSTNPTQQPYWDQERRAWFLKNM